MYHIRFLGDDDRFVSYSIEAKSKRQALFLLLKNMPDRKKYGFLWRWLDRGDSRLQIEVLPRGESSVQQMALF